MAQANSVLGDVDANLRTAQRYAADAAAAQCQLLVFPELFLQGYNAPSFWATAVAASERDERAARLIDIAAEHGLMIVMGTARKDVSFPHLVYNSAFLVGPTGLIGYYDKVHIGNYETYTEGLHFAAGDDIPVFDTPIGNVGIEICYDVSYPEVARTLALKGATVHVILSAGGSEFVRTWDVFLAARSLENAFFTVYANTVGVQGDADFVGRSRVVGPDGVTVGQGPDGSEALVVVDIDPHIVEEHRQRRLLFRDRKPSAYAW